MLDLLGVMLIPTTLEAVTTSNPQADSPRTLGHTKHVPLQIYPASCVRNMHTIPLQVGIAAS